MSRLHCGIMSSAGLQHKELRELVLAVIEPLKSGLQSFNTISEMLLNVDADLLRPGCQTFHDIRREIENMNQQLEKAEQVAMQELQRLNEDTMRLTAEQKKLSEQKKQTEGKLENWKNQVESCRSSLKTYSEALETEKKNLKSAEETLNNQIERRDGAREKRNVGVLMSLIPVVGLFLGPAMIISGQMDMKRASEAADQARDEVQKCECQMSTYSTIVLLYESQIQQAERDIQQADSKIRETAAKLQDLSVQREVIADVQAITRRAIHQLGSLSGVGNAAEVQTRCLIQLEPMMEVMEEMTSALARITGNELLHTEGIKSLTWDSKKKRKLKTWN